MAVRPGNVTKVWIRRGRCGGLKLNRRRELLLKVMLTPFRLTTDGTKMTGVIIHSLAVSNLVGRLFYSVNRIKYTQTRHRCLSLVGSGDW